MNGVFINYYYNNPGNFKTYLWIYWTQSVLIGVFNFFSILSIKHIIPGSMQINRQAVRTSSGNGCIAFFFLFHFEFFHFVYAIFLLGFNNVGVFDAHIFKYASVILLLNQLVGFVQQRMRSNSRPVNLGKVFFIPYLRVIPMHLCILLPAFFHVGTMMLFLILKAVMDVLMQLVTSNWYWNGKEAPVGDIAHTDLL